MSAITVLAIDADDANRNFLAQLLQKKGYAVKQAATGEAGIQMVAAAAPNLIIFDSKLPDMSVMDLIEGLQKNPAVATIPCVVLSSHSDPDEMRTCLQAGCAEYYIKSGMVMMTLVDAIPRLLADGKRLRTKREKGFLFTFLSAKGGTGTSSLCANIGMNMANHLAQSTVAVADIVLPMGSIAPLVGVPDSDFNLISLAEKSEEEITSDYLSQRMLVPTHWNFHLLPGAPDPETAINLHVGHIPKIINSLRLCYDYVLVDLGRSLSKISLPIIQDADLVALILSTDLSTVNHTKKLWHYLRGQGVSRERMFPILNRAVGLEGLTKAETERILELEIRMTMPYLMGNFTLANNQNTPISVKFPTDTATIILKQAAIEMSQQVAKMQSQPASQPERQ